MVVKNGRFQTLRLFPGRESRLPIGVKFVLKFVFRAAKEYPDECEAARKDIDKKVSAALKEWIQ